MRDIINGSNPVLFMSPKVKEICRSSVPEDVCLEFPKSFACRSLKIGDIRFDFPEHVSVRKFQISDLTANAG